MIFSVDRRSFLARTGAAAAGVLLGGPARALTGSFLGPEQPFDFDILTGMARELAARNYEPPPVPHPREAVAKCDENSSGNPSGQFAGVFPVGIFHPAGGTLTCVRLHVVEGGAARILPAGARLSGLRLFDMAARHGARAQEWVAFLADSTFRAVGDPGIYGLSARILTIGGSDGDEAPAVRDFYLEALPGSDTKIVVYSLVDTPSLAGAFRFGLTRTGAVSMDVETRLFLRKPVQRLGVAPCTSALWRSPAGDELRHADELASATETGPILRRSLRNPVRRTLTAIEAGNPRGFGLLTRGTPRLGERPPSLWVQPLGDWGRGSVLLIERPAEDELQDNISAMWVPERSPVRGEALTYRYRLRWTAEEVGVPDEAAHRKALS